MLTGKFQYAEKQKKPIRFTCFSLHLDNGHTLNYADDKHMGKVYLTTPDLFGNIPGFATQGIDILSKKFTESGFTKLISKSRQQVRVFIMDQSKLSAIGNAYADEILFDAGLHPKTTCNKLKEPERKRLFQSIYKIMRWGIKAVEKADLPIETKVRDHVKARNRKGEPCPNCGDKIRRASVLGYDSFFCPRCQPAVGKQTIPW